MKIVVERRESIFLFVKVDLEVFQGVLLYVIGGWIFRELFS